MTQADHTMADSDAHASESEALHNGLLSHKDAVERWLQDEVAPIYDALKANPAQALSVHDVRARLAQAHDSHASRKGGSPVGR